MSHDRRGQRVDRCGHADIAREHGHPVAAARERCGLPQGVLSASDQHYAPALGHQFQGDGPPDAGAGAGYDRER